MYIVRRLSQQPVDNLTDDQIVEQFYRFLESSSWQDEFHQELKKIILPEKFGKRKLTPSSGYDNLCTRLKNGYFDLVLTFNIDFLLERAIREAGITLGMDPDRQAICINPFSVKQDAMSGLLKR